MDLQGLLSQGENRGSTLVNTMEISLLQPARENSWPGVSALLLSLSHFPIRSMGTLGDQVVPDLSL